MKKVVITDYLTPPPKVEQEVLKEFADVSCLQATSEEALAGRVEDADGLIVFHEISVPASVIARLDRCKVLVRCGVGVDSVDLEAAGTKGIVVSNVPDYGVDEVADHASAMTLACNRGLMVADRGLKSTLEPWNYRGVTPVKRLSVMTLGIIGLGRIGTATALRARALKMRVLACDPYIPSGVDKAIGVEMASFDEVLTESDVVSLHVPLTDETRNMIDANALAKMKSRAVLINTARGAVVDVDALAHALEAGQLAGAGIDVLPVEPPSPESPLIRLWQRGDRRAAHRTASRYRKADPPLAGGSRSADEPDHHAAQRVLFRAGARGNAGQGGRGDRPCPAR